jgi:hypothetical protein
MPPKSYFGYVEREADSYVNWADVGRTITNTVDEIDRVRTEKKAAIDAAYKEELQRINDKPMGQKDDVNKWTIDMAYNAAENLKIQNNLLKSGKLAVKDYAIYLQNTSDSIKNLYGTVGQIQTAFQERLDRQANGENQDIEMWDGQDLEQYGKLTDLGANFNINGNLTFSRLETVTEDGKTITRAKPGSENLLSVNQLSGAVSTKYNKYDYLKDADDFIKRLGEGITAYRIEGSELQAGSITQITDKSGELNLQKVADLGIVDPAEIERLRGVVSEYAKAEEEYIKAALNPKYNKSSILTEELGYKTTDNVEEAKKNPKLMLVQRETDGTITPILNETQEKEAREFLRGQYRQMIDKKLQIDTYTEVGRQKQEPRPGTPAEFEFGAKIKTVQGMGDEVGKLYSGDLRTRETVLAGFNLDDKVDNMYYDASDDGKNVSIKGYLANGKAIDIPYIRNGEKVTVYEFSNAFAQAIGRKDLVFENDAVWKQALKKHEKYSEDWGLGNRKNTRNPTYWTPQAKKTKPKEEAVVLNADAFKSNQDSAAKALSNNLQPYGLTVKPTGTKLAGYGYNYVAIYDDKGTKLSVDIPVNNSSDIDRTNSENDFRIELNKILSKRQEANLNADNRKPPGG